jgi:hypothetical protein
LLWANTPQYVHGSQNQERFCWRGPAAIYWTGLDLRDGYVNTSLCVVLLKIMQRCFFLLLPNLGITVLVGSRGVGVDT